MRTISAEDARENVVKVYERLHNEGVNVLSAAIERVKGTKATVVKEDTKAEAVSDSKPSLASLLLAVREE